MFKEIKDEKAFDGILNQIIDNIHGLSLISILPVSTPFLPDC